MPITPENRPRYPANWREISLAVRAEAGNRCEKCGVPNGALIRRGSYYGRAVWIEAGASAYCPAWCAETGERIEDASADLCDYPSPPVRIVLTVAHLDHQPENNVRANLRAWCQRCHNRHDAAHRAGNRRARK
jgi:hypothetical protein